MAAAEPWTTLPIISWFVDQGITFGITEAMDGVDTITYFIYVSIKDAERVAYYVAAQASGNIEAIDASADNLIKLGGE